MLGAVPLCFFLKQERNRDQLLVVLERVDMSSDDRNDMILQLDEGDATGWEYRGEGAANVVLAYRGDHNSVLVGKVLRLRKAVRNDTSTGITFENALPLSADERKLWEGWPNLLSASNFVELNHVYARDVLRPLLGDSHVDPGILVNVSPSFVATLTRRTGHKRPAWRAKSGSLEVSTGIGFLMSDHTHFAHQSGEVKRLLPTLSVEIKPKCGFLPSSAAIKDKSSVKRDVSRFRMHQLLKASQGQVKTISKYDPLDLFSENKDRILKAIHALIETPQNNLRIFLNGEEIFGAAEGPSSLGEIAPPEAALEEALKDFVPISTHKDGQLQAFEELIADLLFKSDILQKLLAVQKLDHLDIEGVIDIYQEFLTDNRMPLKCPRNQAENFFPSQGLTQHLGFSQPKDAALKPSGPYSLEDSRKILQDFLISTTAKDCGLMLTLQPVGEDKLAGGGLDVVKSLGRDYFLKISLLDLDLKRLKKINHYFKLDQQIVDFYKSIEIQAS